MRIYPPAIAVILFIACGRSGEQGGNDSSAVYSKLRPCAVEGSADSVFCGTYAVFENRGTGQGRKIELSVTIIPAIRQDSVLAPIFFFEGGPGVAASGSAGFYAMRENPYRRYHDVVLIDARGTGNSNALHCRTLEYKAGLQNQFEEMYPEEAVKKCYDSLSKRADLALYTTTNMAADMDEVRQWLGYDRIHLFGLSFGTRLALEYMRRYPDKVETTVLWSPTTTYSRMPLYHASFAQTTLEKIYAHCSGDSLCRSNFPRLKEEFDELMRKGLQAPFRVSHRTAGGEVISLSIPWYAFQTRIRSMMYAPFTMRQVPYVVHEAALGNWKPFISMFPEGPDNNDFIAEGLYLCVTCSEDVPFITPDETASLTNGTFMGTYRVDQQQTACANWVRGTIPDDFGKPVQSDAPVLILTGSYDPVTPVSMAKDVARYLPNSQIVEIAEMAHTFDGLSNEDCFDGIVVAFFDQSGRSPLNSACVQSMKPDAYKVGE